MEKKVKLPIDINKRANQKVDICYCENEDTNKKAECKNPAAVELGCLGGLKGGMARAVSLTPEKRSEIAKKAASKRWSKTIF
jgi:hypothetical protein